MHNTHYDFIEIGTSDFQTLIESAKDKTIGLSIEPIKTYLDRLPNKENVFKVQAAVSDSDSTIEIYHIPLEKIRENGLQVWVKGCNSVSKPHDYARNKIGHELYDSLVQIDTVPTITWKTLIENYNIGGVKFIKIDTEGHDHIILKGYLDECKKNPSLYANKIKFEYNESSNKLALDELIKDLDIYDVEILEENIVLTKKTGLYYKEIKIADAGYVINLPSRLDRKEKAIQTLSDLNITGYEFIDGVIMDNPEFKKLGCTQTYLNIFKNVLTYGFNNVIVFEDDIKLMNGVNESDLEAIFSNWDNTIKDYDVVALGIKLLKRSKITKNSDTHGSFKEMLCSQALFYHKHFIEHYVSQMKDYLDPSHYLYKCPVDVFLNDCTNERYRIIHSPNHKLFNFGITIPMVFTQTSSYSDNELVPQNYDKIMENNFWKSLLHEKAYVLYANEQYFDIVKTAVKSIREFSNLPILVYLLNSDLKIDIPNVRTIRWDCNIDEDTSGMFNFSDENFYINRESKKIYNLLIQRPQITKDALKYSNTVAYIDSDSVATPYIDTIFDMYNNKLEYPYFVEGIYEYLHWNGRGGAESRNDLSTTLEHPACELFNVNQYVRNLYRQTGYYVAGQNTIDFLDEWYQMCTHPEVLNNFRLYAPYHEETIVNVLLWKYNITQGLPYLYVNGGSDVVDEMYTKTEFKGPNVRNQIRNWVRAPKDKETLLFFHGEKRIDVMEEMITKIKNHNKKDKKIKVLFLAPHLSTGGMPGFLLKRIESLLDKVEIFVVEYSNYSSLYVVQKNKIIKLLEPNHYYELGENKMNLINIIKNNNIDIVHVDEMIEGFDTYNQMSSNLMNELYSNDRTWRMVETCHNVLFNPSTSKKFNPDAYAFCTPFHKEFSFSDMPSYGDVIEFPIENKTITPEDKLKLQLSLGLDPNKIHVINVGLWTSGKNQKEGVEIARLLESTNPEIQFHFIGNQAPNFREYWEPIMNDLPSNVKVWGERNDADLFMKSCDVFMFNSTWECNPLVLREAISYGLKILSRNLKEYLDMFTPYIKIIDSNIDETKEKLLSLINEDLSYSIPEGQLNTFIEKHINLYSKIINNKIEEQPMLKSNVKIIQHFVNQPFLEIVGNSDSRFEVKFFDEQGVCHYSNTISSNSWVRLNREYYTKWTAKVWENGNLIYENTLDYTGKRVLISFDSKSLGDTIAWIPYALEFKKKHNCHVTVSTFWNKFFKKTYPELIFVEPGSTSHNLLGMYKIGWLYNSDKEPTQPNTIPLQQTITNILGLDYTEIKPTINYKIDANPYKEKYVTIATNSTSGCKFWTKEGWQELINYLVEQGYKVVNVSKEVNEFENASRIKDTSIEYTMNVIHHSEFFIGLSSGLSWLAWGLGKHVVMISNFTTPDHEFSSNCTRIINLSVCNGCWNNPNFTFDKGDWLWCPVHKGTDRQFECHTSITSKMVINQIQHLIP